jgi:hypothetical protein
MGFEMKRFFSRQLRAFFSSVDKCRNPLGYKLWLSIGYGGFFYWLQGWLQHTFQIGL